MFASAAGKVQYPRGEAPRKNFFALCQRSGSRSFLRGLHARETLSSLCTMTAASTPDTTPNEAFDVDYSQIPDRRARTAIAVAAGVDERSIWRLYTEPGKRKSRSTAILNAMLAAIDAAGAPRPVGYPR